MIRIIRKPQIISCDEKNNTLNIRGLCLYPDFSKNTTGSIFYAVEINFKLEKEAFMFLKNFCERLSYNEIKMKDNKLKYYPNFSIDRYSKGKYKNSYRPSLLYDNISYNDFIQYFWFQSATTNEFLSFSALVCKTIK